MVRTSARTMAVTRSVLDTSTSGVRLVNSIRMKRTLSAFAAGKRTSMRISPFVPTQLLEFLSKRRYLGLSGEIGFGPSAPRRAAYAPAAAPSPRAAKQRPIQRKTFQGVIRHGGSVCPSSASQYRPTTNSQDQDDQCDMSTGTVIVRNMLRVTPPSTNSRKREWP